MKCVCWGPLCLPRPQREIPSLSKSCCPRCTAPLSPRFAIRLHVHAQKKKGEKKVFASTYPLEPGNSSHPHLFEEHVHLKTCPPPLIRSHPHTFSSTRDKFRIVRLKVNEGTCPVWVSSLEWLHVCRQISTP